MKVQGVVKSVFMVILGSLIFAISINSIVIPNALGEGGVTGITVLLYYIFKIPPAYSNLVINSVILFFGWRFLEKQTIFYTILSVLAMSFFLKYVTWWSFTPDNILVAALGSGMMLGIGIGIVVLGGGTTAGSDIIALILNKLFSINVSASLFAIDVMVVTPLFFVIGPERGLVTLFALFIGSRILNFMLEGLNPKKQLMIISDHHQEIAQAISTEVDRGITILNGRGYYSGAEKEVLMIIVNQLQMLTIQRIVVAIDPNAFVITTQVQSVHGEGFTFFLNEETGAPA